MFAVIKTGGKQYIVTPDQKIKIEKITGDQGANVSFDKVLLVADGDKINVGTPDVSARVEGNIIRQARDKKKIVFKYHSKARVRKTKGHRQPFTEVQITSIK